MPATEDGPASPLFTPLKLQGSTTVTQMRRKGVSRQMADWAAHAPTGRCVARGICFEIGKVVLIGRKPVTVELPRVRAPWLVFLHASDIRPLERNEDGFFLPTRGTGQLGERAADYVVEYAGGQEVRLPIRRRCQIGCFHRQWGELMTNAGDFDGRTTFGSRRAGGHGEGSR